MFKVANIFLIGLFVALTSCSCNSKDKEADIENISDQSSLTRAEEIVRSFAQEYQPDSLPYAGVAKMQILPDSLVSAFKTLRSTNPQVHNKWLTVIFLKVFLDHLRCCHQGFEIRNNVAGGIDSSADPLLYEYAASTKLIDLNRKQIEFINSGIADKWVEQNPSLAGEPEIKAILAEIKPIRDSIAKGLYW